MLTFFGVDQCTRRHNKNISQHVWMLLTKKITHTMRTAEGSSCFFRDLLYKLAKQPQTFMRNLGEKITHRYTHNRQYLLTDLGSPWFWHFNNFLTEAPLPRASLHTPL